MDTYRRTDLIHEAVTAVAASVESMRDTYQAEVTAIDGELASICRCTPRECRDKLLTPDDTILWQLNWPKFASAICKAFQRGSLTLYEWGYPKLMIQSHNTCLHPAASRPISRRGVRLWLP